MQSWPAAPEHVGSARRVVSAAARRAGAGDPVLDAVRLAVSEAVSNVVVHGYRGSARGAFTVAVEWEGDELRVTVRDEGCGMQPRPDSPGAGLGLYISRGLVRAHGGELEVGDAPEGGTRFTFWLPVLDPGDREVRVGHSNDHAIDPAVTHITVPSLGRR